MSLDAVTDIAAEITELRDDLDGAYERRADAIAEALADGNSLRDIADAAGISHTAVRNAVKGL